jgi:hypothetical protein
LYNSKDNSYGKLGNVEKVYYDDKFIKVKDKIYYPYKETLIDISDYYNEKLKSMKTIRINEDIGLVLSKRDYIREYDPVRKEEIKRIAEEEINRKIREKQEQDKSIKEAARKKEEEKQRIDDARLHMEKSIRLYSDLVKNNKIDRVKVSDLYEEVDDHLEIKKEYIPFLKFIDLSGETFKNVNLSGIDFRDTNINLYPQIIYQKDLSNCNFEGLNLGPFINFSGVIINGAHFSYDDDKYTIDVFNTTFDDAIYDENTTFNGKPIVEYFKKEKSR